LKVCSSRNRPLIISITIRACCQLCNRGAPGQLEGENSAHGFLFDASHLPLREFRFEPPEPDIFKVFASKISRAGYRPAPERRSEYLSIRHSFKVCHPCPPLADFINGQILFLSFGVRGESSSQLLPASRFLLSLSHCTISLSSVSLPLFLATFISLNKPL
jgi:hypothetical protein